MSVRHLQIVASPDGVYRGVDEFLTANPSYRPVHYKQVVTRRTIDGVPQFVPDLLVTFATLDDPLFKDAGRLPAMVPPNLPVAAVQDATATLKGVTRLTRDPATLGAPIAVGDNDTRMLTDAQKNELTGGGVTALHTHTTTGGVSIRVRNQSGSTINKGKLVAVVGWSLAAGRPLVDLADKDTASLRPAVGVVIADLANNQNGDALQVGTLDGVNTSAFALTDQLVLGDMGNFSRPPPDVAGFTGEIQYVGSVSRVDATDGQIAVSVLSNLDVVTADQVYALQGTSGTPSDTNRYVTNADKRLAAVSKAEATGDATFSTATDALVAGMTLTPAAGTYLAWFGASVESTALADVVFASIYADGVQVAASEREIDSAAANESMPFTCLAHVAVNGTQAVEGRARNNGVATATVHERQLVLLRVGP